MNFKKVLALVLVVAMCLSMIPTYAFADDVDLIDESEAVLQDDITPEDEYLDEDPVQNVENEEPEAPAEEPAAPAEEAAPAEASNEPAQTVTEDFEAKAAVAKIGDIGYTSLYAAYDAWEAGDVITIVNGAVINATTEAGNNWENRIWIEDPVTITSAGSSTIALPVTVDVPGKAVSISKVAFNDEVDLYSGTLTLSNVTAEGAAVTVYDGATIAIDSGSFLKVEFVGQNSATGEITGGSFFSGVTECLLQEGYVWDSTSKNVAAVDGAVAVSGEAETQGTTTFNREYYTTFADAFDACKKTSEAAATPVKLLANMTDADMYTLAQNDVLEVKVNDKDVRFAAPNAGTHVDGALDAASGITTFTVKAGSSVATIGTVQYGTLKDAFASAKDGDTIKLARSYEVKTNPDEDLDIYLGTKAVTLDLNNYTLTEASNNNIVVVTGTVTIDNGNITGDVVAFEGGAVVIGQKAAVTGDIRVSGTENKKGSVTINGTVNGQVNAGAITEVVINEGAMITCATKNPVIANGTLTINGGEITATGDFSAIELSGSADVVISGGTVKAEDGIALYVGQECGATVTGGTFTSSASYALYVGQKSQDHPVLISGGTFVGKEYAIHPNSTGTQFVGGGNFSSPVKLAFAAFGFISVTEANKIADLEQDYSYSVKTGATTDYAMAVVATGTDVTDNDIQDAIDAGTALLDGQDEIAMAQATTLVGEDTTARTLAILSGAHTATLGIVTKTVGEKPVDYLETIKVWLKSTDASFSATESTDKVNIQVVPAIDAQHPVAAGTVYTYTAVLDKAQIGENYHKDFATAAAAAQSGDVIILLDTVAENEKFAMDEGSIQVDFSTNDATKALAPTKDGEYTNGIVTLKTTNPAKYIKAATDKDTKIVTFSVESYEAQLATSKTDLEHATSYGTFADAAKAYQENNVIILLANAEYAIDEKDGPQKFVVFQGLNEAKTGYKYTATITAKTAASYVVVDTPELDGEKKPTGFVTYELKPARFQSADGLYNTLADAVENGETELAVVGTDFAFDSTVDATALTAIGQKLTITNIPATTEGGNSYKVEQQIKNIVTANVTGKTALIDCVATLIPANETEKTPASFTATLEAVEPVAEVNGVKYASIRDASEANPAVYVKDDDGAGTQPVITVLQDNLTYVIGSARDKETGKARVDECIYIDRAGKQITVQVSDSEKYTYNSELRDDTKVGGKSVPSTAYTMGEIVAVVDGVAYCDFDLAVKAANNGEKLITIVKAPSETYELHVYQETGKEPVYEVLYVSPAKSLKVAAPTQQIGGRSFYYDSDPAVVDPDGAVKYTLKPVVATAHYVENKASKTKQFDSFAAAAEYAESFAVADETTGIKAFTVELNSMPLTKEDTFNLLPMEKLTVEKNLTVNPDEKFFKEQLVFANDTEILDVDMSVTGKVVYTALPIVATVTDGVGNVTRYTDFYKALDDAAPSEGKATVTIMSDVGDYYKYNNSKIPAAYTALLEDYTFANEWIITPDYEDVPFTFVNASGVTASVVGFTESTVLQDYYAGALVDETGTPIKPSVPEFGYTLVAEDGVFTLTEAVAAVDFGTVEDAQDAQYNPIKKHTTFGWSFYTDLNETIEAAANEHAIVLYAIDEDFFYGLGANETLTFLDLSIEGQAIQTWKQLIYDENVTGNPYGRIYAVEDKTNNKNYKQGWMTSGEDGIGSDLVDATGEAVKYTIVESVEAITISFDLGYTPDPKGSTDYTKTPEPVIIAKGGFLGEELPLDIKHQNSAGYTFDKWLNGTSPVTNETVFTESTTLTASWTSEMATLTFVPVVNNEKQTENAQTINAVVGDNIAERVAGVRAAFKPAEHMVMLDGWYEEDAKAGYKLSKQNLDVMPETDSTFYVLFEGEEAVVTLVYQAGGSDTSTPDYTEIGTIETFYGDVITWADVMNFTVAEGDIKGYYIDNPSAIVLDDEHDFTVTATAVTLVAAVDDTVYVGYYTYNGRFYDELKWFEDAVIGEATPIEDALELALDRAPTGKSINPKDAWRVITRDGERNWIVTEEGWSETVTGTVYYAANYVNYYTITAADGSKTLGQVTVYQGETLADHEDELLKLVPTKDGYSFTGWDMDEDVEVTENTVIHAQWVEESEKITVTWLNEDGSEYKVDTYARNDAVVLPTVPTKEGTTLYSYEFDAWYLETIADENRVQNRTGIARMNGANVTAIKDMTFVPKFDEIAINNGQVKYSYSISLEDSISINFKVRNIPANTNLDDYDVAYTLNGVTEHATLISRTSNMIVVGRFAAKEVVDSVNVEVFYKGSRINEKDFNLSIKDYCDAQISANANGNLVDLCDSLLDYATYAQDYFQYRTDTPAKANPYDMSGISIPKAYAKVVKEGGATGISGVSLALNLESKTEMFFYFKHGAGVSLDDYSFSLINAPADINIDVAESGTDKFVVKVIGIAAKDVNDQQITINVTNNNDNTDFEVTAAPSVYMYLKQNADGVGNVVKALFEYGKSAATYAYNA